MKRDPINNEDLKILDGEKVVATGRLEDGMIVMNDSFVPAKNTFKSVSIPTAKETLILSNTFAILAESDHYLFGHLGSSLTCEVCIQSKKRRRNIPKVSSESSRPLEKIDVDIQGPFPIAGIDKTKYNIKVVDNYSGFVKMETILDKSATTTKDVVARFISRAERQIGDKVKVVRTDGGNEFNGAFLEYLESCGIIKHKGNPYDHHFPPYAENAHLLISRMAKPMLNQSKLPLRFYTEAMLCATYLLNRFGTKSRFEKFFGVKPRIDHLKPFGSICYAFIPAEKRTKLDDVREKCRLLGYADDFDTEEMSGYKLLVDLAIVYSNDVVFPSIPITELPDEPFVNHLLVDIFHDDIVGDPNYSQEDISGSMVASAIHSRRYARRFDQTEFDLDSDTEYQTAVDQDFDVDSQSNYSDQLSDHHISEPSESESADGNSSYSCYKTHKHDHSIPGTLKEVDLSHEKESRKLAMDLELEAMEANGVWDNIVDTLPTSHQTLSMNV